MVSEDLVESGESEICDINDGGEEVKPEDLSLSTPSSNEGDGGKSESPRSPGEPEPSDTVGKIGIERPDVPSILELVSGVGVEEASSEHSVGSVVVDVSKLSCDLWTDDEPAIVLSSCEIKDALGHGCDP